MFTPFHSCNRGIRLIPDVEINSTYIREPSLPKYIYTHPRDTIQSSRVRERAREREREIWEKGFERRNSGRYRHRRFGTDMYIYVYTMYRMDTQLYIQTLYIAYVYLCIYIRRLSIGRVVWEPAGRIDDNSYLQTSISRPTSRKCSSA